MEEQVEAQKPRRRIIVVIIIVITVLILGAGGWIAKGYYQHQQVVKQVPEDVLTSVDFGLFLPKKSVANINAESFDYSLGVVQFTANYSGAQLQFAEQKKTPEFDISKFAGGIQISGVRQLTIPQGQVVIGSIQDKEIAIMDTGGTIITLTGSKSSNSAELVMRSLQKL